MDKIVKIQSIYRMYFIKNKFLIPSAYYQTKLWRQNQIWYKNGKSNECEKYQINLIEQIIKSKLEKTNDRINIETFQIINKKHPNVDNDGYEFSENFDGKIIKNDNIYYFNLKFVCDNGGAQTRSLREVYHFIKYQLEYLLNFNITNTYFFNILDGDTSYNNMDKFNYLINKEKYLSIVKYVFVGSLSNFNKKLYCIKII